MNFFITAIFSLFISWSFSQENQQHIVQKGESLYRISKKYNVSISELEALNPTAKKGLTINSVLQISAKKDNETLANEHIVIAKETLYGLSKNYHISLEKLKQLNPKIELEGLKVGQVLQLSKAKNNSDPEKIIVEKSFEKSFEKSEKNNEFHDILHTVLPKETKYGLSKKYKISITELERLNPQIKNELAVGVQLVIKTSNKIEIQPIEKSVIEQENRPIVVANSSKVETVISSASNNIGTKYRSGGTDAAGFDCSGLMFSIFKTIDMILPRSSWEQASFGEIVDKNWAQKGDLIFFATGGSSTISHVGLITEVSENDIKFIHSSSSSGVIISSIKEQYYQKRFVQINRVIPE